MKRMIGGVVAFVPSCCNTVFSFYIEFRFIVLAVPFFPKKISCYHETVNGDSSYIATHLQ